MKTSMQIIHTIYDVNHYFEVIYYTNCQILNVLIFDFLGESTWHSCRVAGINNKQIITLHLAFWLDESLTISDKHLEVPVV